MTEMKRFACLVCKFSTSSKYSLDVHFDRKKHVRNTQPSHSVEEMKFQCRDCDKRYKEKSGLWRHSKTCKSIIPAPTNVDSATAPVQCKEEHVNTVTNDSTIHLELLEEMKKMNKIISNQALMLADLKENQQSPQIITNNSTINNNTFNMSVFLNEKCNNAICLNDFIKNLRYELSDRKLLIESYVEGTCDIIQKNLEELPLNKRPLHYLQGEDQYQQLMHIRNGDKWDVGTELNWMQQIHADDDDNVLEKNPIYYALKEIDDEKLKYMGYNFNQDKSYMLQHGRLHREISRPDFKEKVYQRIMKMITLDTENLETVSENVSS